MNTNNENMTVIGPDELAELEETAIDGSQDSARILYHYYQGTQLVQYSD